MTKEDKLLKIIEGLQDTIRKLESERITFPVREYVPYPIYPERYVWPHPYGCNCNQCTQAFLPFKFTYTTGTTTIGSAVNEVS